MKRQQDRDTPPKLKRSHPGYVDYDVRDRELLGPDRDRRDNRSRSKYRDSMRDRDSRGSEFDSYDRMSSKGRHGRDDRQTSVDHYRASERGHDNQPYRTLCCSNLNPRASDQAVRDELYNEFKRFGDFNVRVVHTNEHRIAFVNFRYPEDARSAGHSVINKLVLFDMPVRVETVFNNRPYEGGGQTNSSWNSRDYVGGSSQGGSSQRQGYDNRDREYQGQGQGYASRQQDEHGPSRRPSNFREGGGAGPKFPHHLNHIEPEDDDKATRTLFVGNLDIEIADADLRAVFERFGTVDDIDIKRPQQGNAYAFLKFFNLDMAHRAKVAMSGEFIGKFQCKIGYGKPAPSPCLWVGGLGQWVSAEVLEREMDRFGLIHRIEWPHGKSYAYVLYDNIDAATAALKDMRGFSLGGPERRLRVDFADLSQISGSIPPELKEQLDKATAANANKDHNGREKEQEGGPSRSRTSSKNDAVNDDSKNLDDSRYSDLDRTARRESGMNDSVDRRRFSDGRNSEDDRAFRTRGKEFTPPKDRDSDRGSSRMLSPVHGGKRPRLSPGVGEDSVRSGSDCGANGQTRTSSLFDTANIEPVENITELAKCLPVVWSGALVLKNSAFLMRLHLVSGDVHLVDTLMRDTTSTEMAVLKITQRLRLDQSKVDDVKGRIASAGPSGHSVLLAQNGSAPEESYPGLQQRPLKNLVTYLKDKKAAGIITLPPNPSDNKETGVLHACPPCDFGNEFLTKRAPKLNFDNKDDYLVVVVVRGSG